MCAWIMLLFASMLSCISNHFVRLYFCFYVFFVCVFVFCFLHYQHPSTMNESSSTCDHELVSSSLTIATLPLLVLTRKRSQSLTNEISDAGVKKGSISDRLSSHSFDCLNFGKTPPTDPRSLQDVPRIIVISPTSESSLINHDSCLEESVEAMENNVFVSLNFSSEVFEAVKLLSWPAGLCCTLIISFSTEATLFNIDFSSVRA